MRKSYRLIIIAVFLLITFESVYCATFKDDIGFVRLWNELGADTPDGSGVWVTQVEALSSDHYMPDVNNSDFTGKTITDKTGEDTGTSSHATGVGKYFYGTNSSTSPGITDIHVYEALDWLQLGFLGAGYLFGGNPFQPVYDTNSWPWVFSTPARVANHSWVGSAGGSDILRRLDFVAARDEYIQITALNNDATNKILMGDTYNGITVGRTDGIHPMGTSSIDDIYISGRVCPLIVAPFTYTSTCAPVVASVAALLIETGRNPALSSDSVQSSVTNRNGDIIYNAERLEVIKAALMAGARRVTDNAWSSAQITDYQQTGANGLDTRFGSGQLDIYSSYFIVAGGEQNSAEDDPINNGLISGFGFDVAPAFGGENGTNTTGTYSFTPTENQRRIYAALVWNLRIDGGTPYNFDGTAITYDLNLTLYDTTVPGYSRLVGSSSSDKDNTENLWAPLVPGRTYQMEVTVADGQDPFTWDYALAWRMETPPDGDEDGIPDDWEVQYGLDHTSPDDADLDPDNDGLTHVEEFYYGTDLNNPDTDGDGQTDGTEVVYHSDPLNPQDLAEIPNVSAVGLISGGISALLLIILGAGRRGGWNAGKLGGGEARRL